MTRLLCSLAFAAGFGLAWWLATRKRAQPVEDAFTEKMMKKTATLNKNLTKIKQDRQDEKRTGRLSNGT